MNTDADRRRGLPEDRLCRPTVRLPRDDEKPAFGRWIGLINGRR